MTLHTLKTRSGDFAVPFLICLGGRVLQPHPILGPAYTACPYCTWVCPDCDNTAVFHTRGSIPELKQILTVEGFTGLFCACGGFLGVVKGDHR